MAGYKVFSPMLLIVVALLKAQAQMPAGMPGSLMEGVRADIEAIEAQARVYETALAAGEIETIQNIYAEDCRVFPNNGPPYIGREELGRQLQAARDAGIVTFDLTTTEIFPMGQYYYRSGTNRLVGPNNTTITIWDFITIFRKDCGEWLYFVDMVNDRFPPPSP